jgi:hypothetical protein
MWNKNEKLRLIEELKQTPIIGIACKKAGISRASYHRWRDEDPWFREQSTSALREGRGPINDRAESVIIKNVNRENISVTKWWLGLFHDDYKKMTPREENDQRPTLMGHVQELVKAREKLEEEKNQSKESSP